MAYRLKQDALEAAEPGTLSPADQALCAEQTYELSPNGQPEVRRARLRTLSNLRFAFDVAARAHGAVRSFHSMHLVLSGKHCSKGLAFAIG